tara:strand:- start:441 stop:1118 length:678 start_codon:yes stop_codon:yes gene_type:complete
MSGKQFSDYLKGFREKRGLSKASLAKAIKKTPTYIHRLEKNQCTPPTFEISNKLSSHLQLNSKDHNTFIEAAFIGRLQDDIDYYKQIKKQLSKTAPRLIGNEGQLATASTANSELTTRNKNYLNNPNTVQLTLQIIPEFEFTSHIKELIKALVTDTLEELEETVFETTFTDSTFDLVCTNHSHSDCIDSFVENIKSYTSAVLSHHLNNSTSERYIWQKEHKVSTS